MILFVRRKLMPFYLTHKTPDALLFQELLPEELLPDKLLSMNKEQNTSRPSPSICFHQYNSSTTTLNYVLCSQSQAQLNLY